MISIQMQIRLERAASLYPLPDSYGHIQRPDKNDWGLSGTVAAGKKFNKQVIHSQTILCHSITTMDLHRWNMQAAM